jgi:hypothetical protein
VLVLVLVLVVGCCRSFERGRGRVLVFVGHGERDDV